jgi:hypothetical protein
VRRLRPAAIARVFPPSTRLSTAQARHPAAHQGVARLVGLAAALASARPPCRVWRGISDLVRMLRLRRKRRCHHRRRCDDLQRTAPSWLSRMALALPRGVISDVCGRRPKAPIPGDDHKNGIRHASRCARPNRCWASGSTPYAVQVRSRGLFCSPPRRSEQRGSCGRSGTLCERNSVCGCAKRRRPLRSSQNIQGGARPEPLKLSRTEGVGKPQRLRCAVDVTDDAYYRSTGRQIR